jgi:allantoin racemase
VKPMIENMVRLHGLETRCASIRTTPLSVLDCENDPTAAEREILREAKLAIADDGAEAILLGCGGMGPLDQTIGAELPVPVIDGIPCAVKLLEGLVDYGLSTSRAAAYKEPEPKEFIEIGGVVAGVGA